MSFAFCILRKIPTLVAMRKKQKVQIAYTDNWGALTNKPRIPLMVAINHGEIYIGCVSQHHPDKTYALKLRQMVLDSAKELVGMYERE